MRADKPASSRRAELLKCGEGGIRTPDAGITDVTVFETAAFNRSATSPPPSLSTPPRPFNHPRTHSSDYTSTSALLTGSSHPAPSQGFLNGFSLLRMGRNSCK